ncbi:tryptophan--tRNA ligase [Candidatus Saccharibacteria bacterium]|nr:tryptophan--tRNA ligase [Candidatus Saccharibacteria bacterium]
MSKPVILTGLRANNDLTIGNYFGGILPMIDMAKKHSDEYQINMFVPDLHSFTTPINFDELHEQIWHNMRLFVAAGLPLDNPDIHLYRQSYIPAHSELTWILDCFTGFGEMSRMTQFKDKSGKLFEDLHTVVDGQITPRSEKNVSVGLFNYPVLMAADILLYNAAYVPVGDDQTQHLEFTRDIAQRINNKFGDIFTIPKSVKEQHKFFGKDQGLRIKDLVDPTKKMSKSDDSGKGVIFLSESPEAAAKKIMSATTDDLANIQFNRGVQPGISNLLEILALFTQRDLQDVVNEWQGKDRYGDFKKVVADETKQFLTEFQTRLDQVDDSTIEKRLKISEDQLTKTANETLFRAQKAVGLRPKE